MLFEVLCSNRLIYVVFEVYVLYNVALCGFLGRWVVTTIYDLVCLTILLWSLALTQFIREYASI
jgi:hypothetical protein